MATKAQAFKKAESMSVELDYERMAIGFDCTAYSPDGKVFVESGCHVCATFYYTDAAAFWAEIIDKLNDGLEDCTDADCEHCNA